MIKLTLCYARYALLALATAAFSGDETNWDPSGRLHRG